MHTAQAKQFGQAIRGLQPRQMGALPLIQPILTDLQVRETVNRLLPSQADVDLGQVVVFAGAEPAAGPTTVVRDPGLA
jgi:hypothetical protein